MIVFTKEDIEKIIEDTQSKVVEIVNKSFNSDILKDIKSATLNGIDFVVSQLKLNVIIANIDKRLEQMK